MTVVDCQEDTRPPSRRVVDAVADEKGADPTELEPLYYTIDPDALDRLFVADSEQSSRPVTRLSFTYADHRIVVAHNCTVEVTRAP